MQVSACHLVRVKRKGKERTERGGERGEGRREGKGEKGEREEGDGKIMD